MKLNALSAVGLVGRSAVKPPGRGLPLPAKRVIAFHTRSYPRHPTETGVSHVRTDSSSLPSFNLLLIGDEAGCAARVWSSLEGIRDGANLNRRWVTRLKDVVDITRHLSVDLIFCELSAGAGGFERLDRIRELIGDVSIVVLVGSDSPEVRQRLVDRGMEDQLARPDISVASVRRIIGRAIERQQFREEIEAVKRRERLRGEILSRIADNAPLSDVLDELNRGLRRETSCEDCSFAVEMKDGSLQALVWAARGGGEGESNACSSAKHSGASGQNSQQHNCEACLQSIRSGGRLLGELSMVPGTSEAAEDTLHAYAKLGAELASLAVDRLQTTESLRQSQQDLLQLSAQLMSIQETERQRIAGDLHDVIGQSLSVVKVAIEEAEQQFLSSGSPEIAAVLGRLVPWVKTALGEVRRISMDLRPAIIDDLGILPTLSWFFREFGASCRSVTIEPDIRVAESDVPESLKIVIFRILQESISNIVKHAQATRVHVRLQRIEATLQLLVSDDGKGFDLMANGSRGASESSCSTDRKSGLGLSSMRERARCSGGFFTLDSAPGSGTRVMVNWPLHTA